MWNISVPHLNGKTIESSSSPWASLLQPSAAKALWIAVYLPTVLVPELIHVRLTSKTTKTIDPSSTRAIVEWIVSIPIVVFDLNVK